MENAKAKAEQLIVDKYEKDKANIAKWEVYREKKIELTANFIKVLKRKNLLRRWLKICKQGQKYAKIRQNLYIRRALDKILFASYFVAIHFKVSYLYRYRKQYGFDMVHRKRNEMRRALNFSVICKFNQLEEWSKETLSDFMFRNDLIVSAKRQFASFFDRLLTI